MSELLHDVGMREICDGARVLLNATAAVGAVGGLGLCIVLAAEFGIAVLGVLGVLALAELGVAVLGVMALAELGVALLGVMAPAELGVAVLGVMALPGLCASPAAALSPGGAH